MRKQFITFFLFSFSLIFFSASFVFGFSGASSRSLAPQNPAIYINCLNCHGKLSPLPSSLKIDESAFNSSAHATLSCLDCHPVSSLKEGPVPHEKKLPSPDCTASCHRQPSQPDRPSPPLSYRDSVHGRAYLERGERDVARCWDCHGKHNILPASHPQSTVNRLNIPRTCSVCHENMAVVIKYHIHREAPYQEYKQSVHGRALFTEGVATFAAVCTDCHGVHNIQGVGEPHLMARQPATCARCHEQIFLKYKESIHGIAALKGDPNAPLCVDCHGEHKIIAHSEAASSTYFTNIPQTCATCHARPDIMKKYGIPADRVATFIESLHGIALGYGLKGVATCVSCHGSHEILPASDPRSSIHPANLVRTCNQSGCHSGMPESVARTKIHVGPSASRPGVLFYLERILIALVILTIFITFIWFIPGFIRRLGRFKGKKG